MQARGENGIDRGTLDSNISRMGDVSNLGYVSQSSNSAKLVRASTQFTNSQGRRRIDINASDTQSPCFYVRVWQDLTSSFLLLTIYCSTMCTLEKSSDSHYYDGCSFLAFRIVENPETACMLLALFDLIVERLVMTQFEGQKVVYHKLL